MQNKNNYIYGKRPVEEILIADSKRVQKIFIKQESRGQSFELIKELASKAKIPISFLPAARLKDFAGAEAISQGVVALIGEIIFQDLDKFLINLDLKTQPALFLLDEIEDPQNVGAIIRSAAGLGLSGVIIGKHRQAPITAAVYKASAGTAAKIPLIRVTNLNNALEKLKKNGFWIAALDQEAKENIWQADLTLPLVFILGNEATGVRSKILANSDFTYHIPMMSNVESLNVSATAAIVAYEWARKKALSKVSP